MTARFVRQSLGSASATAKCHKTATQPMSPLSQCSIIAERYAEVSACLSAGLPANPAETSIQGLYQRNALVKLTQKLRQTGIAAIAVAAVLGAAGVAHAATTLVETGSSLLYPLFNIWVPDFTASNAGIQLTTTSTGSGAGIAQAIKGLVQVGASDAYMSNALVKKNPDMLNIPLAISAQAINYNLPGLNDKNIKLSGPVLAAIYTGKITMWNDPAIKAANPASTCRRM
jgi:phosphate transport system substrate-binding protein